MKLKLITLLNYLEKIINTLKIKDNESELYE